MQTINEATQSLQALFKMFNLGSVGLLIAALVVAFIIGKLTGLVLRAASQFVRKRADASANLATGNLLRRAETWIILSIAIVQVLLVIAALYIWWNDQRVPGSGTSSSAIIGMSALAAILIGGVTGPLLRDLVFGASMMAEHWYGVGDLITIDFPSVKGVVEAVTLRSTRVKGINGQTYWVANSAIQGVGVARRGVLWVAVELFVGDVKKGEQLIDAVNELLPSGASLMAEPLVVKQVERRSETVWRITAVGGVAPGREWIIEDMAVATFKKLDEKNKKPILINDPFTHFDDREAEHELRRAVKNARKPYQKFDYTKLTPAQIASRTKKSK